MYLDERRWTYLYILGISSVIVVAVNERRSEAFDDGIFIAELFGRIIGLSAIPLLFVKFKSERAGWIALCVVTFFYSVNKFRWFQ